MTGRYSKELGKGKGKVNGVWLIAASLTTMGTHMAYGITQCYLPPGTDDIPTLTPAQAGTRFSDPGRMQG